MRRCTWLCWTTLAAMLMLQGAVTSESSCYTVAPGQIVPFKVAGLPISSHPNFRLEGNTYGAGGHASSLTQCLYTEGSTFGWNWTRGHTNKTCAALPGPDAAGTNTNTNNDDANGGGDDDSERVAAPTCKAPPCFADFTFSSAAYGISPWGGGGGDGTMVLPVNTATLSALTVSQNVSLQWTDDAPHLDPPEVGANFSRRIRFIYDFFLTSSQPSSNGSVATSITDEVTINFASNSGFPGSQPPGCIDPDSRFGNSTIGPVLKNAVWDGYNHYDYWYTDHHDAVPGTGTRYSSFRRVGAELDGAQMPAHVDLLPFLAAIKAMWPGDQLQVGPWLGQVAFGTELYDHCTGNVIFHQAPTFQARPLLAAAGTAASSTERKTAQAPAQAPAQLPAQAPAQNDTARLQSMIDKAGQVGGGARVLLVAENARAVSFGLTLRSNIQVVIDGVLATDGNPHSLWHGYRALLNGAHISNTTITTTITAPHGARGTIDGNGAAWWPIRKQNYSFFAPTILKCEHCAKVTVSNLNIVNTPAWNIEFSSSKDILVDNINVNSPSNSPNTDGVGLGCAGTVDEPCILRNSVIYNGDDEVAVGGSNVLVEDCEFGTGHGASIGSLGFDGTTAYVSNVTFRRLKFNRTGTTLRVKTWQGGHGLVHNVTYSDIELHQVQEPLLITQYYCPSSQSKPCKNQSTAVKVHNITFERISGTYTGSTGEHNSPGQLLCSDTVTDACSGIRMQDVALVWVDKKNVPQPNQSQVRFECWAAANRSYQANVTPNGCLDTT